MHFSSQKIDFFKIFQTFRGWFLSVLDGLRGVLSTLPWMCSYFAVLRRTRRPAAVCLSLFLPVLLVRLCFFYHRHVLNNSVELLWIFDFLADYYRSTYFILVSNTEFYPNNFCISARSTNIFTSNSGCWPNALLLYLWSQFLW